MKYPLHEEKWEDLRLGMNVTGVLSTAGKIVGLVEGNKNIEFTRDIDGFPSNTIIIQWENEKNTISVMPHWLCASITVNGD